MNHNEMKELAIFAKEIQIETIKAITEFGMGHVGGALSMAHCLAVLYGKQMKIDSNNPYWEERDWFVLSKGHCGPALYATLALKGFFSKEELKTINRPGTNLPSHCDRNKTPGIDMTTGSLGQGGSCAAGIAQGHKISGRNNYTYLMMGDGECQEGQVWEMALFAAHQQLDHLIAFVDRNKLQLDGFVEDINALGDLKQKFTDFNWHTQEVNGHDVAAINQAIENAKANRNSPSMIILDTIKGEGWSEIANKTNCHSMSLTIEDSKRAIAEMQEEIQRLEEL